MLLESEGYQIESFSSAEDFLAADDFGGIGCILLDVHLDGKSGFDLQEELIKKSNYLPIIFISGQGDIPMSVKALKKGAVNFLTKPFDDHEILKAVKEALEDCKALKTQFDEKTEIKNKLANLTSREFEIFRYVITGLLNKQIAADLRIAEQTVKIHRGKITEKLGVKSVAEMVRIAEKAGISFPNADF